MLRAGEDQLSGSFVSGQAGCALILKGITTGETLFWSMDINSRSWPLLFYPVHLATPFIPVDSSTPFERLKAIMASARPQTILAVDSISGLAFSKLSKEKLEEICEKGAEIELPYPNRPQMRFFIFSIHRAVQDFQKV